MKKLLILSLLIEVLIFQGCDSTKMSEEDKSKEDIIYKGKSRSAAWFEQQYEIFKNKIAFIDGQYVHINRKITRMKNPVSILESTPPKIGECRSAYFVLPTGEKLPQLIVFSIINDNEALVGHEHDPELYGLFHFRINTEGMFDGSDIPIVDVIYVGTYSYISTIGSRKTIKSYMIHEPLTKDQFKDALTKGFDLEQTARNK